MVYDDLNDEAERPYLEWSSVPEDEPIRLDIETDPIAGPEHPGDTHPDATSEWSVIEMDATVIDGAGDVTPGEYRLAVSSSRLARALGDHLVMSGDTIVVSWHEDGDYRDYDVSVR